MYMEQKFLHFPWWFIFANAYFNLTIVLIIINFIIIHDFALIIINFNFIYFATTFLIFTIGLFLLF